MDEYIERDTAIEAVRSDPMGGLNYKRILTDLPAADAVPVVYGEWIFDGLTKCSECGYSPKISSGWNFCPNCGAKMDGGEQDG